MSPSIVCQYFNLLWEKSTKMTASNCWLKPASSLFLILLTHTLVLVVLKSWSVCLNGPNNLDDKCEYWNYKSLLIAPVKIPNIIHSILSSESSSSNHPVPIYPVSLTSNLFTYVAPQCHPTVITRSQLEENLDLPNFKSFKSKASQWRPSLSWFSLLVTIHTLQFISSATTEHGTSTGAMGRTVLVILLQRNGVRGEQTPRKVDRAEKGRRDERQPSR